VQSTVCTPRRGSPIPTDSATIRLGRSVPADNKTLPDVHPVFNTEHYASRDISDGEFALLDTNCLVR
jgi:hypothetical protein